MGVHALREVLRYMPDRLIRVFTAVPKEKGHVLIDDCERQKIPLSYEPFDLLTKMAGSDSHQSFVAYIKGRKFYDVNEFLEKNEEKERIFLLMLSMIFDPHNFGALLRSAECFGVDGVIWSKNRGCDLNPTVTKTSCGASELLPLIRISNLAQALDSLKEAGFEIVASIADSKAESCNGFRYAPKSVLIVGSEGEGIQPLLSKKADRFITIPLYGKIESLNVAQSAAILLSRTREML